MTASTDAQFLDPTARNVLSSEMTSARRLVINQLLARLYDVLVAAIVLTGPLVVYGTLVAGFSLRFSRMLIILTTPFLLLRILTRPRLLLRDRFVVFGFAPYLAYTTVSILWSPNVETGPGVQRLGGLYEIVIVYLILTVADLDVDRFLQFVKLYVASAVIPMGISAWQFANNLLQFSTSELPFGRFVIEGKYEPLEGRYFVAGEGFSRLSGTFAEPNIFSSFICSVLLLSFLVETSGVRGRIGLRLFQGTAFIIIVLSISKLALLSLSIGLLMIARRDKRFMLVLAGLAILFAGILGVMSHYGLLVVFDRLIWSTGHYELLVESLAMMERGDLLVGEGIGSVPYGSFHRLLLSRVYESGLIGLVFVGFVSVLPLKMLFQRTTSAKARQINTICVGVMFAIVFGLHSYDYFIHLFPWTAMGAVMSFYYSEATISRAEARRRTATRASPGPAHSGALGA